MAPHTAFVLLFINNGYIAMSLVQATQLPEWVQGSKVEDGQNEQSSTAVVINPPAVRELHIYHLSTFAQTFFTLKTWNFGC